MDTETEIENKIRQVVTMLPHGEIYGVFTPNLENMQRLFLSLSQAANSFSQYQGDDSEEEYPSVEENRLEFEDNPAAFSHGI